MSASHTSSSSGGGGGFVARFSISTNSPGSVMSVVPVPSSSAASGSGGNNSSNSGTVSNIVQLSQVSAAGGLQAQNQQQHHNLYSTAPALLQQHQHHHTPAVVMFTNSTAGAAIHSTAAGGGNSVTVVAATVAATTINETSTNVGGMMGRVSAHASPVRSQSHFYHHPHPSHPLHNSHHHYHHRGTAAVMPHFSVDSAAYQQIIDRRKSFRTRGSLGPTVASAPSVEQEDYRTPKPSVEPVKNGKSFDFGGGAVNSMASDSNGLIKVSADFLRLNGSRQQFRSLLSRKKLGQMPPAYTRIDYSHDSIESNNASIRAHHPLITVEDAAAYASPSGDFGAASGAGTPTIAVDIGLGSRHNSGSGFMSSIVANSHHAHHYRRPSISSTVATVTASPIDLQKSSFDKSSNEKQLHCQALLSCNNQYLTAPGQESAGSGINAATFKRANSRYGAPIDESAIKLVYKIRSQRLNTRVHITNRCVLMAMIGILLMVVDTEICGQALFGITKSHPASLLLRSFVVLSTIGLLLGIIHYHINEILLELVDCGADDFRVVLTWNRIFNFSAEFVLCSICPLPFTGTMRWSFIEPARYRTAADIVAVRDTPTSKDVPVDVLLSMMMLSRVYLIARFMVLHSKQFQDASTRTLAALNRIQVNFAFVMKTVLDQRPVVFLSLFLLIFWLTTAWTFAQCERIGRDEEPSILYTNALWFIAITFNGNGYGDIVPKTIAGKSIAVLVGIFGAVMSSILIAVISKKIVLSQGQKNVNNFMNDSRLIQEHKNAAARVLQKTWHIYKCLKEANTPDHLLRRHQRCFLDAIHKFRRIKNKIRVFNENSSTSFQQMNRLMTEMHTSMQRLVNAQDEMRAQIEVLQRAMRNHFTNAHANNSNNTMLTQNNNSGSGVGGSSSNAAYGNDSHGVLTPRISNSYTIGDRYNMINNNNVNNSQCFLQIVNSSSQQQQFTTTRVAFDSNVQTHFISRGSEEQSKRSMSATSADGIG